MGWISWRRLLLLRGRSCGEVLLKLPLFYEPWFLVFTCIMFWRVSVWYWFGWESSKCIKGVEC